MIRFFHFCLVLLIFPAIHTANAQPPAVDFQRDVQPLFRRHCYRCHGQTKAEGGFRLSLRKEAMGKGDSGETLISPQHPAQSLLLARLTDESLGDVMPLDSEPLSEADVSLIKRWIEAGAIWPDEVAEDRHWAYAKPIRPALPKVKTETWPKNAIDRFVLARLEREGVKPSPEAERTNSFAGSRWH